MRIPRVFVAQPLTPGATLELDAPVVRHLLQVLRLERAAPLVLFNGDGRDYTARIHEIRQERVSATVAARGPSEPSPPLAITLGLGIAKGERMDFALQKAVELGVHAIAPLLMARSVVKLDDARRARRHQHWHGIVVAACEQSGRRRIPELYPIAPLADWLSVPHAHGLLLDRRGDTALVSLTPPAKQVTLLIGPEGGLTPTERTHALAAGFRAVRLGPRVMRAETAPLAAIAALQTLWGDFATVPDTTAE